MAHPNLRKFIFSFCSEDIVYRNDLCKPNYYDNGYIIATDSYSMVMMHSPDFRKKDCYDNKLKAFHVLDPLNKFYEGNEPPIGNFKTSDLGDIFEKIKKIPEFEDTYKECKLCQGTGSIECDCCGNEKECEDCEGEGEIKCGKEETGYYKFPDDEFIKINNIFLRLDVSNKIYESLKMIDAEELEVFDIENTDRLFFRIKDTNIYILQMGVNSSSLAIKHKIILLNN